VIGIVVVSHGPLSEGLIGAAEMIVGEQRDLRAVSMGLAADVDHLRTEIESAVQAVGGTNSALVLVDLLGGSPSNASAYLAAAGTPVVCGVNLPMLLEMLMSREASTPRALADQALRSGKDNIIDLGERLAVGTSQGRVVSDDRGPDRKGGKACQFSICESTTVSSTAR
jgi:PTS system mannose-specific IIA component